MSQPSPQHQISHEQAATVHERVLVFDGHNDTPVKRIARGDRPMDWMREDPTCDMDVPRMQRGGMDGGIFIVGNGAAANVWATIEQVLTQIEQHGETLQLARSAAEVEAARATARIAVVMGVEGAGRWLEGEADVLRLLHRLGVRVLGITHGEGGEDRKMLQGEPSPTGPCNAAERRRARREGRGLSEFGEEVLALSNELGILTDLAHINDRAFYQVLERSSLPVMMSHTAACALCPQWRCMTDDQIRALADADGVIGIAFAPWFLDDEHPSIDRVAEHVCYVAERVGIDHVAIGSDFDGLPADVAPVVTDVAHLPELTRCLLAHGLNEEEVAKVWGGNYLRLMRRVLHQRAAAT
ncbi:MAG: dipeptidase [Phycisphaeraceae bacterium]